MNSEITENHHRGGLDRRRVLQATAWSVPVIAVAVAAPAMAASPAGSVLLNVASGAVTTQAGTLGDIPRSLTTVAGTSSAQANFDGARVLDGDTSTTWHTQYSSTTPGWITLQGPSSYDVTGLYYLPRQDTGDRTKMAHSTGSPRRAE